MPDWFEDVLEFHRKFGCRINALPMIPEEETIRLRLELVREEIEELREATAAGDVVKLADALADSVYVLVGMAISCGIDLRPVWDEVHRSNMAKEGGGTRFDGKITKPPGWQPPNVAGVLDAQQPLE